MIGRVGRDKKTLSRSGLRKHRFRMALSQPEPHCYQEEILDAIADLHFEDAGPRTDLIERLRTTQWLTADDKAVAPKDLLRLPPEADEAAEQHLARPSRYTSSSRLPERIRTHPGFRLCTRNADAWSTVISWYAGADDSCWRFAGPARSSGGLADRAVHRVGKGGRRSDAARLAAAGRCWPPSCRR